MIHQNEELVRALLEGGADPNIARQSNHYPLFIAIKRDQVEFVRMLLEHGADPTIKLHDGHNIQGYAVHEGNQEVINLITQARLKRIKERRINKAA